MDANANANLPLIIPTNGMSVEEKKEWRQKFYKLELPKKREMFDAMSMDDKRIIWEGNEVIPTIPIIPINETDGGRGKKLRTRKNKRLRKRKSKSQKRRKTH
jgi:hypothetical protein